MRAQLVGDAQGISMTSPRAHTACDGRNLFSMDHNVPVEFRVIMYLLREAVSGTWDSEKGLQEQGHNQKPSVIHDLLDTRARKCKQQQQQHTKKFKSQHEDWML